MMHNRNTVLYAFLYAHVCICRIIDNCHTYVIMFAHIMDGTEQM